MKSRPTSGHQRIAGLDGLRGLAVTLVLGFHLYPRLMPGGWLGVSLFFTLSGFLITTVILRDRDNNTFTFTSFYSRRARRLLPAAFLVLAVFTMTWTLLGWFDTNHRQDVFFSMLQIANWQQIWEGIPYGAALASPVVHYWSLAIEEQAYVVLPLLIVIAGRRRLPTIATLLFAISIAATFLANANQSVIYFGTHTRAAEILAGVIVAAVVHNTKKTPHRNVATIASAIGLTYLVAASLLVHLNDDIVYSGGLVITGIISAVVIATIPHTPIASLFNTAPLVWLGTVSYGIYLIHWPVLQTLKNTDLPQWSISPLTLIITFTTAQVMYRFIETPIRVSFSLRRSMFVTTFIMIIVLGISATAKPSPLTFEEVLDRNRVGTLSPSKDKISIFLLGDSRALTFSQGSAVANDTRSDPKRIFEITEERVDLGCPIGRGGRRDTPFGPVDIQENCDWSNIEKISSDVVVIWAGKWDSIDRDPEEIEGEDFLDLSDTRYRQWLKNEYTALFNFIRRSENVKAIAVVNHNSIPGNNFAEMYNEFLVELSESQEFVLLDLKTYMSRVDQSSFLPDNEHLSFGEPTEYSPTDDNSAIDLYKKWFEPVLCSAIQRSAPDLLTGVTCPAVDNSPRSKD